MHCDDDDFEFTAVPVSGDMQEGLLRAFREANAMGQDADHCPICDYLASQGHETPHDHGGVGGGPIVSFVRDDIDQLLAGSQGPVGERPVVFTHAQNRRFRKRRK